MDLRQIDTSDPPDPRLHKVRIADAIAQGKPPVINFAPLKFCTSRVCGPVVDIVRSVTNLWRAHRIHAPGNLAGYRHRALFPTADEWHLHTEPWSFVVDGKGIFAPNSKD